MTDTLVPAGGADSGDVDVADFNDDGNLDLVFVYGRYASFHVYLGDGAGGFVPGPGSPFPYVNAASDDTAQRVDALDIDGDGLTDVAVKSAIGSAVEMHFGTGANGVGDAGFSSPVRIDMSVGSKPLFADLNKDGLLDVVAANYSTGTLAVYLGAGARSFSPANGSPFFCRDGLVGQGTADLNGDRIPDLVAGSDNDSHVVPMVSELKAAREPWAVTLGPGGWELVGDVLPGEIDRFGDVTQASLTRHLDLNRAYELELLQAMTVTNTRLVTLAIDALTHPWTLEGDLHWLRVEEQDVLPGAALGTGPRLRVVDRLGARTDPLNPTDASRQGLDLADPTAPRGVVIELPILDRHATADVLAAAGVRVYRRATDWARASEIPEDPFYGTMDPLAAEFLPRIPDATDPSGYRDVVSARVSWTEILADVNGNLADGSGERFVVQLVSGKPRVIRVLTDRLGTFQAFLQR